MTTSKTLDINAEVAAMQRLTAGQLQEKYAEVCGEPARSRHRQWLIRRIAWRLQALAEGDLSERARRRVADLATEVRHDRHPSRTDWRTTAS